MSGNKVGIGQLELVSLSLITPELKAQLQDELNKVKAEGRHSAVLVITDIMKEGSELMMCSDNGELIAKALNTQVSDEMWMPGVMSRKKQVVPNLEQAFKA